MHNPKFSIDSLLSIQSDIQANINELNTQLENAKQKIHTITDSTEKGNCEQLIKELELAHDQSTDVLKRVQEAIDILQSSIKEGRELTVEEIEKIQMFLLPEDDNEQEVQKEGSIQQKEEFAKQSPLCDQDVSFEHHSSESSSDEIESSDFPSLSLSYLKQTPYQHNIDSRIGSENLTSSNPLPFAQQSTLNDSKSTVPFASESPQTIQKKQIELDHQMKIASQNAHFKNQHIELLKQKIQTQLGELRSSLATYSPSALKKKDLMLSDFRDSSFSSPLSPFPSPSLPAEKRIKELERYIQELKAKLRTYKDDYNRLASEKSLLETDLDSTKDRVHKLKKENFALKMQMSEFQENLGSPLKLRSPEEIRSPDKKSENIENEMFEKFNNLQNDLLKTRAELQKHLQLVHDLRTKNKLLKTQLKETREALNLTFREKVDQVTVLFNQLSSEAKELQERENSLVGINKSIIQSNIQLLEQNQQLQEQIELLRKEKEEIYKKSIPTDSPFCNMKLHQQWKEENENLRALVERMRSEILIRKQKLDNDLKALKTIVEEPEPHL